MERNKLTNDEKIVSQIVGNKDVTNFHMAEDRIDTLIAKEKAAKFDEAVDQYIERLEKHTTKRQADLESVSEDISNVEIKPMFGRIIFVPFENNPFQKLRKSESGLIIDIGGLNPQHFNTDKGVTEDSKPEIITGAVQEVGPDVKYVKPGDVIYYRDATAIPVPFFKQGFYSVDEHQVIAIVNSGLTDRFKSIEE